MYGNVIDHHITSGMLITITCTWKRARLFLSNNEAFLSKNFLRFILCHVQIDVDDDDDPKKAYKNQLACWPFNFHRIPVFAHLLKKGGQNK